MLKYTPFSEIKTWSDNRWTNGDAYRRAGFSLEGELRPDYSYVSVPFRTRRSKQAMQKKRIDCPSELTEREWCLMNGWFRIWDCGKRAWSLKK